MHCRQNVKTTDTCQPTSDHSHRNALQVWKTAREMVEIKAMFTL